LTRFVRVATVWFIVDCTAAIVGKLEFILGLEDRAKSVIRKTAGV
jgi:hypothetical protein